MPTQPARFRAHTADDGRCRDHPVPGAETFLEAAVAFAERHSTDNQSPSIIVIDNITGEQQCFHVDLGEDIVSPCENL